MPGTLPLPALWVENLVRTTRGDSRQLRPQRRWRWRWWTCRGCPWPSSRPCWHWSAKIEVRHCVWLSLAALPSSEIWVMQLRVIFKFRFLNNNPLCCWQLLKRKSVIDNDERWQQAHRRIPFDESWNLLPGINLSTNLYSLKQLLFCYNRCF